MPASFELFGLTVHLYGLLIGLGILIGVQISQWAIARLRMDGIGKDMVWDALWWGLIGGVVGARLYHVVDYWNYYSQHLSEIVAVWNGGLGIFGGIVGGMVGLWWYSRRSDVKWMTLLDVGAIGLPWGQAIGRWGNYVNQEVYGRPFEGWWAIVIDPVNRLSGYEQIATYHPLFLYESVLMIGVGMVLLWLVVHRKIVIGTGQLAACYLVGYGLVRGGLEPLRIEPFSLVGLPVAQWFSLVAIACGLVWLVYWRNYVER